jgi:hypothetical protein
MNENSMKFNKHIKILALGSSIGKRLVHLNRDLFIFGFTLNHFEYSSSSLLLNAVLNNTPNSHNLNELCDVSKMSDSQRSLYLSQIDFSKLIESDYDIIIIDCFYDVLSNTYANIKKGWACWVYKDFLKNIDSFNANFEKYLISDDYIIFNNFKRIIKYIRLKNPNVPILFLKHPLAYYKKITNSYLFDLVENRLVNEIPGVFSGGDVSYSELIPYYNDSNKKDYTLLFDKSNYLTMLKNALDSGMHDWIENKPKFSVKFSEDNPKMEVFPFANLSFKDHSKSCISACDEYIPRRNENLKLYINIPYFNSPLKWTPVLIDLEDLTDFDKWESQLQKKFKKRYLFNRSVSNGYVTHQLNYDMHIPDVYDINHSAKTRSGGEMRGDYLNDIAQMGGAPKKFKAISFPRCPLHWSMSYGIFEKISGHMQGDVKLDERLLGYITLRRMGDLLMYTKIMGHNDFLDDGIMYHLHYDVLKWILDEGNDLTRDTKYLMYGGIGNGSENLWQWKRMVGFQPYNVLIFD